MLHRTYLLYTLKHHRLQPGVGGTELLRDGRRDGVLFGENLNGTHERRPEAEAAAQLKAARLKPASAAEMKAARDARYAARKARK